MPRFLLAALAAAVSLLAVSPSIAHAETPCAKRVIADWTKDGEINGNYSARCLRQAYRSVPEDLGDYSSIKDDITAAMAGSGSRSGPPQNGTNNPSGPGAANSPAAKQRAKEAKRRAEAAVPHASTSSSIPDKSRSIPLPLLILAAVMLAALLAALSPPLIQRVRTRFPRARRPAPQADRS
jgi:hypothetical protein